MKQELIINNKIRLGIAQLNALAQCDTRIVIDSQIVNRLAERRRTLEQYVADSRDPVYGVNTGVGAMKTHIVSPETVTSFNERMVRDHAAGFGEWLNPHTTRLSMAIRIFELSLGGSGISVDTFLFLVECYNCGIIPVVPEFGSVGEADITILAHIARLTLGQGRVWRDDAVEKSISALERYNLTPIKLQARDGLALIGGNSYTYAITVQACVAWKHTRKFSGLAVALSWIAWHANVSCLREDVLSAVDVRTVGIAAEILRWIGDTNIMPQHIQDPLSWRCTPQLYAAMDSIQVRMEEQVLKDIHSTKDNPLVLDNGAVVSNGNFDITTLALEIDALRNGLFRVMAIHAQRIAKLLNHHYSNLSPGLALTYGDAGLGLLDFNVSALMTEADSMAKCPLAQVGEVAEGVEDYGSLASVAAQRLSRLIELWEILVATEILSAIRAIALEDLVLDSELRSVVSIVNNIQSDTTLSPYDMVQAVRKWMKISATDDMTEQVSAD